MTRQDERAGLLAFLGAQRRSVLAIVDGLDDDARQVVVPSGWTAVGMVEHLAHAERYWFQYVLTARQAKLPWPRPEGDPGQDGPFVTAHPLDEVLAFYRRQCAIAGHILASVPLTQAPVGEVVACLADEIHSVRDVILHMIEETARHAGHLDVARELVDGRTGLGPR